MESNMLEKNMRSTLSHAYQNIILYEWTRLGNYIVEFIFIVLYKKTCHPVYSRMCGGHHA